jgi:hypothetical protein
MKQLMAVISLLVLVTGGIRGLPSHLQQVDTDPPEQPVKLIFIHHSTGGNWLADPSSNELGGGLGRALMENNYYVSATNYGWGPDSIGDATDIPNWLDWFRGERSPVYLKALYTENGQNTGDFGSWPRLAKDPGGENQIIVFKSCFPNSDLEGNPNDAPAPEGWLSVSNAKYVYNEILKYFASRPDKLFVVITAPPLSGSSYSDNARAFNLWLVNDWLGENNYTLNNVAVFDFYNVLTGSDHHHRINNGQVEHTYKRGQDLLYYPSGDDHPSRAGNAKATEEFIPMLNAFYNRWKATAPEQPPAAEVPLATSESGSENNAIVVPMVSGDFIEDFEGGATSWEMYLDEGGVTDLSCAVDGERGYESGQSLQLQFTIAEDGWATCTHYFDDLQNWNAYEGLSFAVQSAATGGIMHIDLYAGSPDSQESYYCTLETPAGSSDWSLITIPWQDFKRVDWEEDAGAAFTKTDQVMGLAFGFPGTGSPLNSGTIWIDDVRLVSDAAGSQTGTDQTPGEQAESPEEQPEEEIPSGESGGNSLCGGAFALPMAVIACGLWLKRHPKDI